MKKPVNSGYTTLELIASITILMLILGSTSFYYFKLFDVKNKHITLENFDRIFSAFKGHYTAIISDAVTSPSWIPYSNRAILPVTVGGNPSTTIRIYTDNVLDLLVGAGCEMIGTGSGYRDLRCIDAWGNAVRFSMTNMRPAKSLTSPSQVAFDPRIPVLITVTSAGVDRTMGTGDDITAEWSSARLDEKYIKETERKIQTIAEAIRQYQKTRMYAEIFDNNQLQPADAILIPWLWQLTAADSTSAYLKCQITDIVSCRATVSCKCDNYDNTVWRTSTYSKFDTTVVPGIISNLGLPSLYAKDAFGMMMSIDLLWAASDSGNVPPVPQDNYASHIRLHQYSQSDSSIVGYSRISYPISIQPVWRSHGVSFYVG
jgi:hypothetical protein